MVDAVVGKSRREGWRLRSMLELPNIQRRFYKSSAHSCSARQPPPLFPPGKQTLGGAPALLEGLYLPNGKSPGILCLVPALDECASIL